MIENILTFLGIILIASLCFSALAIIFVTFKMLYDRNREKKLKNLRDYDRKCKIEAMKNERVRL